MAMRLPFPLTHRRLSTPQSSDSFTPRRQMFAMASAKRSPKRLKYSTPRFTKEGEFLSTEVDPSGVDSWKLETVIEFLKQGAVGVIPTDTVLCNVLPDTNPPIWCLYGLYKIKKIESSKPLSILCRSLRDIDTYTMGFPRGDGHGHANVFRAVKQCLPGPYTFILTASKELPKQCVGYGTTSVKYASRKNVGVRISDDAVCQAILQAMDAPLICTSVKGPKENEWMIDPTAIGDIYGPEGLDFVVDGGVRVAEPSTIVDMTGPYPKVIREGKVKIDIKTFSACCFIHPKRSLTSVWLWFSTEPILPWMVVEDDESRLREDLIASGT